MLTAAEQLAHCTVRIEVSEATSHGAGTGFIYNFGTVGAGHVFGLVANKHVVAGAESGRIRITCAKDDGSPDHGSFIDYEISNFESNFVAHPDSDVDLCVMPFSPIINDMMKKGKKAFFVALDGSLLPDAKLIETLDAIEDILIVGYPNAIWDEKNNLPVFRRGVTATHFARDYNGRSEFLIDASVFPGQSGSPVLLFNKGSWVSREGGTMMGGVRLALLGIVYGVFEDTATGIMEAAPIPTSLEAKPVVRVPNAVGICIKSREILRFRPILESALNLKFI